MENNKENQNKIDLALKSGFENLCNMFQRWSGGNDEEANCFIILFHVNNQLQFFKVASKSKPPTCIVKSPKFEH